MAKLSARGRKEIARVDREINVNDPTALTMWRKTTVALMSDGNMLEKLDVRFRDGHLHSYGWKLRGKVKAEVTPERFVAHFTSRGYRVIA